MTYLRKVKCFIFVWMDGCMDVCKFYLENGSYDFVEILQGASGRHSDTSGISPNSKINFLGVVMGLRSFHII
jgi:hypothetical protein